MADCMGFPDDWRDFLHDYEFKDKQEIYTNGAMLIPSFRVEQMMEHYLPKIVHCCDCWAFNEHNSKKMAEQGFGYCMAHGSCTPVTMRDWFCRNGDSKKPYVR